jgi:membrane-bound lytic murein transglycosylase B
LLTAIAGAFAGLMLPRAEGAQDTRTSFEPWIAAFQTTPVAHGVTEETYTRVMPAVRPDTTGLEAIRNQPEFNLQFR